MDAFISSFIQSLIVLGGLWGQVKAIIPILAISVLFELGITLIQTIINAILIPANDRARDERLAEWYDGEHEDSVTGYIKTWDIDD